jgi:hypothetical protein
MHGTRSFISWSFFFIKITLRKVLRRGEGDVSVGFITELCGFIEHPLFVSNWEGSSCKMWGSPFLYPPWNSVLLLLNVHVYTFENWYLWDTNGRSIPNNSLIKTIWRNDRSKQNDFTNITNRLRLGARKFDNLESLDRRKLHFRGLITSFTD